MDYKLKDKVVLVTGASGGIGETIAKSFAENEAIVVVGYHKNKTAAMDVVDEIKKNNGKAIALQVDIGDENSIQTFITEAIKIFSHIDILVNNAGILAGFSNIGIEKMSVESWETMFKIHVTGAFLCTKLVIPYLKRNGGRIINISSVHALSGGRVGISNYAAAKGAVLTLTKSISREFGQYGITANAIIPGFIDVGMTKAIPSNIREKILLQNPMHRFGKAEEISAIAVFLASEGAGYINGQAIACDGGRFDYCLE